jgi:DNA-binding protein H-NS
MARSTDIDKMTYRELMEMEQEIAALKNRKQVAEKEAVKEKLMAIAKEAGYTIPELFGSSGRGRSLKGTTVPPKYRDPENPSNTWTGRGRPPRWLTAATKGVKKKFDDYLIT